jgi:hypothetical protein
MSTTSPGSGHPPARAKAGPRLVKGDDANAMVSRDDGGAEVRGFLLQHGEQKSAVDAPLLLLVDRQVSWTQSSCPFGSYRARRVTTPGSIGASRSTSTTVARHGTVGDGRIVAPVPACPHVRTYRTVGRVRPREAKPRPSGGREKQRRRRHRRACDQPSWRFPASHQPGRPAFGGGSGRQQKGAGADAEQQHDRGEGEGLLVVVPGRGRDEQQVHADRDGQARDRHQPHGIGTPHPQPPARRCQQERQHEMRLVRPVGSCSIQGRHRWRRRPAGCWRHQGRARSVWRRTTAATGRVGDVREEGAHRSPMDHQPSDDGQTGRGQEQLVGEPDRHQPAG